MSLTSIKRLALMIKLLTSIMFALVNVINIYLSVTTAVS